MMDSRLIGNRFEIGERIGHGGMGDVYRGIDTHTNQPVAVKFLKSEILSSDPGLLQRFEREGEALRRLNHPNIIKMLMAFQEDGQHYLVMEYVAGGSLRDLLEQTPQLSVERILDIALDLADALTRAHRLHIIHRDIKPANVLLAEDGTPRLGDFGVAHMGDRTRVTESGSMIGTYAYMSPEGCSGEELDERADIWSFGVMLYEMLAGRRPFDGMQPAVVLTAILTKPIPDLLQYRPDAPAALVGLIYSMLEKDRKNRISSIRLVGAQLEAFIKGSDTAIQRMTNLFNDPERSMTPPTGIQVVHPPDDTPTLHITTPPPSPAASAPTPLASSTSRLTTTFPVKSVVGGARVFLSYRREDSIAVTGRIYDRLVAAFGEAYVFKDVDKIPVGANFKAMLENEVASCDVLLAVIGQNWLDSRDTNGQRRLHDSNDFVRIEINAALDNPNILVIPVLVNNALMPIADHLPPALTDLAFRNAAVIRNDPDFNRDTAWLIEQINHHFVVKPASQPRPSAWKRWAGLALVAAALLIGLWLTSLMLQTNPSSASLTPAQNAGANPPELTPTPIVIESVAPDEYMVLVADLEALSELRDVSRFIMRDLSARLERDIPFSKVRIRRYEGVITTHDEARRIADETGATVIIWGNYTADLIEVEVQIGSLNRYPTMLFDRDTLERTANVTIRMSDERSQSLVAPVLAVLAVLETADGDGYEMMRLLAILDEVTVASLEIKSEGVSGYVHRALQQYLRDTPAAVSEEAAAIALDPGNAILYSWRGGGYIRSGQFDQALQDVRSAERRGPNGWALPSYLRGNVSYLQNDRDEAINLYSRIIELRPDDWFPYNMRAWFHYLNGDFEQAKADYASAFERQPNTNFPYIVSALIALREGRMNDARSYLDTIIRQFPDPAFANRLIRAAFGGQADQDIVGPLFSAVGDFTLEQYDQMLLDTQKALEIAPQLSDLHALEGFAYCNLGQYAEAEQSYTDTIALVPDVPVMYLLRADVRLKQLNLLGANEDSNKARALIRENNQGEELVAYLDAGLTGQVGCQNFLEWQPPG